MSDPIENFKKSRRTGKSRSGHPSYSGRSNNDWYTDPTVKMYVNGKDTTYYYDPGHLVFLPDFGNGQTESSKLYFNGYREATPGYKALQNLYNTAEKNAGSRFQKYNSKIR